MRERGAKNCCRYEHTDSVDSGVFRNLVGGGANLEFKKVKNSGEIYSFLSRKKSSSTNGQAIKRGAIRKKDFSRLKKSCHVH